MRRPHAPRTTPAGMRCRRRAPGGGASGPSPCPSTSACPPRCQGTGAPPSAAAACTMNRARGHAGCCAPPLALLSPADKRGRRGDPGGGASSPMAQPQSCSNTCPHVPHGIAPRPPRRPPSYGARSSPPACPLLPGTSRLGGWSLVGARRSLLCTARWPRETGMGVGGIITFASKNVMLSIGLDSMRGRGSGTRPWARGYRQSDMKSDAAFFICSAAILVRQNNLQRPCPHYAYTFPLESGGHQNLQQPATALESPPPLHANPLDV